jgi:hypothetical protein
MRSGDDVNNDVGHTPTDKYCRVCREAVLANILASSGYVTMESPDSGNIVYYAQGVGLTELEFCVELHGGFQLSNHNLNFEWRVNNVIQPNSTSCLALPDNPLSPYLVVEVSVLDNTDWINDGNSNTYTWLAGRSIPSLKRQSVIWSVEEVALP